MCGINGAYNLKGENVVPKVLKMTKDLEHRGQEGCGIAWTEGDQVKVKKIPGSVDELRKIVYKQESHIAIGHTRYSTTGDSYDERNLQPILNPKHHYSAIAHNGNLINSPELQELLISRGIDLEEYGTSDTGLIAAYTHDGGRDIKGRTREAMKKDLKGAYSLVIMTRTKLIAARDPYGIRPLYIARRRETVFFASEDCAFRLLGVKKDSIEEVKPGEMIVIEKGNVTREQVVQPKKLSFCIFEPIYFARPDSKFFGEEVYDSRKALGRAAAREFIRLNIETIVGWMRKSKKVVVAGVPDSGTPASFGFYQEFKKFFPCENDQIFLKVRGARTFLGPDAPLRKRSVDEKLPPIISVVKESILIVIDDSIVRGNTSQEIIKMLKKAGAEEVHFVSSCPRIEYPCFYGIDTADRRELIAANLTNEKIREFLEADSVTYPDVYGMKEAIPYSDKCCLACFTGKYPAGIPSIAPTKDMLEKTFKNPTA